jgi:2-oxoglutarate ferredoxin oxidoreductase subunit alpha
VIVDVQRGGPSTGLPTKTEQADLLQALHGRNSEAPLPVLAAQSPADCFAVALEASRLAVKYMVPVLVLTDGYLANGSEPWRVPTVDELPRFDVQFRTDPAGFLPYARHPETLARPWVVPGTPGLEHRIGGLEKQEGSGHVSYDSLNHERMVRLRAAKVAAVVADVPDVVPSGDAEGELVLVGWGSTFGAIAGAVRAARERGLRVRRVVVPEMNLGQLVHVLRDRFLVDAESLSKVQGKPFMQSEIEAKIEEVLG